MIIRPNQEHHAMEYVEIALIGAPAGRIAWAPHPGKGKLGFGMTAVPAAASSFKPT